MFNNLKLGVKLPGGFAVIIALTCLIAFTGYYSLRLAADKAGKANDANNLVKEILEARLDEKNFSLSRDAGVFIREKEKIEGIIRQAQASRDEFTTPGDRARMEKVISQVREYLVVLENFVSLSERKKAVQDEMEQKALLAMKNCQDIGADQKKQFQEARDKADILVREKLAIDADCNRLITWVLESRAWRISWLLEDNALARSKWEELNVQILDLLENVKGRLKNEKNITVADFALSSYRNYGDQLRQYLQDRSKGLERAMLRAENSALKSIEEIMTDQREQLKMAQAERAAAVDDKLAKAEDADRIISLFQQTRQWENRFVMSGGDPQWKKRVDDSAGEILGLAQSLKGRFVLEKNIAQIDEVGARLREYKEAFAQLAAMSEKQKEAEASMLAGAMEAQRVCEEAGAVQLNELNGQMSKAQQAMVLVTLLGILLGGLMAGVITRSITRPLAKTVDLANAIGLGDLSRRLKLNRRDEIGQLGDSFDLMADSLEAKAGLAQKIASGDLTVEAHLASENDSLGLAHLTMIESLNEVLSQVKEAAVQVASGAAQISDSSQSLSQGASEQAASLEEITSSMTEIGAQTKLNAENAAVANKMAETSREAMHKGNDQMRGMVSAMEEINHASVEIAAIIKTIDGIAFQTNLLALNAAVEAARAGRHGKGFAVVAQEVRNLAARSGQAAQNIAQLIDGSVKKIQAGSEMVQLTSTSLAAMMAANKKVRDLIEQIAVDSNDQAQGVAQINQGLTQIEQVTQQNTANAEQTASAAEELSGQSAYLQQLLTRFNLRNRAVEPEPARAALLESNRQPSQGRLAGPTDFIPLDDGTFGDY
ncbi:MAG: methyl-accepting chemotaxis protein [Pseudomonadota bacterium]